MALHLPSPNVADDAADGVDDSARETSSAWAGGLETLDTFMERNPSVRFLRLQWLDYSSTLRTRILPVKQARKAFSQRKSVSLSKAALGLVQHTSAPGFSATGEYSLIPCFEGLRLGSREGYATVQCEFWEPTGTEVSVCPRTLLRKQVEKAESNGIEFLVGFEIEVVFMRAQLVGDGHHYGGAPINAGHAWSATRVLQKDSFMEMLEAIFRNLERAGIELQQFHAESCPDQYEFVLSPMPPLLAVDTLLAARDIISAAATNADLRATLFPRPDPRACGTGAHVHISLTPPDRWEMFYGGVLRHMKAIAAFTLPSDASYERVVDGVWAGGTWIAWGSQNRETPLRRIEGSHFEFKCMDGLANPYLALAAIFGAGLSGVLENIPLSMKDCLQEPSTLSAEERDALGIQEQLPKGIEQALKCLEEDPHMSRVLGAAVENYVTVKHAECKLLKEMDPAKRRDWLIDRY